ncbi:MAG: sodium:solute symporter family protein [Spirochaetia bacterium]|nr:sodium:solute symporter family protein [Spirochaetia bacterium]
MIMLSVYLLFMIGIGVFGHRYSKDFSSSIDMGKRGGIILLAGSCIGSNIGNGFVVGGAGKGSLVGLAGSAYGLSCACTALVTVFLASFIYKHKYGSLAEYTKERYHSEVPGVIYVIATMFSYVGIFGVQLIAGKALFDVLGLNSTIGTIIIAVVVFFYAQFAGIWGAYATSAVQIVIIIIGLVLTTIVIIANNGIDVIRAGIAAGTAPAGALDFSGLSMMGFLAMVTPLLLSMVTSQEMFVRIGTAKSAEAVKVSHLISFFIMIPLAVMPAFIGVYGAVKYGISNDMVFFSVVLTELPKLISASIVVAVLAAVMSTIACCYSTIDTVIICDFLQKTCKKNFREKQLQAMSLAMNAGITVLAVIMALHATAILDVLNIFYSFLAAACFVPFIGGILFRKASALGASASSVAGIICVTLDCLGVPVPSVGGLFPCIVGAVVFVAVSLIKPDPVQAGRKQAK